MIFDTLVVWMILIKPLLRLVLAMCVGLFVANLVEALGWMRVLARLSRPLVRYARLGDTASAAFSLAFFAPSAANALLSERYAQGELSSRELMLSNVFNSLPSYLVHLPTLLFVLYPVLGTSALIYVGLTLAAATLRTLGTIAVGHALLPPRPPLAELSDIPTHTPVSLRQAGLIAWKRFRKRLPSLILFTVPVYVLMHLMQSEGLFQVIETWLVRQLPGLANSALLNPEAVSIILLSLAAEIGASLSAAGSALEMGGLAPSDIVLALLIGNILSTPMRAIRHQLPVYAGYYRPALALRLVLLNQTIRATSMIGVTWAYWQWM